MVVPRFLLTLSLVAILGVGAAQAHGKPRSQRPPASDPTADESFVQARHAAAQGDSARFEAAAARLAGHPLELYLDYWRLRMRLAPQRTGSGANAALRGSSGEADSEVHAFIARNEGLLAADLLRRDWMLDLGRRGQWQQLESQALQWILRDDSQAQCYAWLAQSSRGAPLPAQANAALMRTRELGEGCTALLEHLAREGTLGRDQLWTVLRRVLEAGATVSVRRVAELLDLPAGSVEAALQRPAKVLGTPAAPQVIVIAAAMLARQDPEQMADRGAELAKLARADRDFVAALTAAHAMRRLAPNALSLARAGLAADVSDDSFDWLARAALRDSDWTTLSAAIARMSPQGRDDPVWVYWGARADRALGRAEQGAQKLRSIAGQFHFYGQLASEELGQPFAIPPRPAPPTPNELAAIESNAGIARALKFYELGLRMEGNREWNFQLRSMSDRELLAAAEFACRRSILDRCVNTAERTDREHDFALRFITPFREQLVPAAHERGLDPAWVYGLIRQESRFILDARSSASAQGLMQIIPPTARWIARKLGVDNFRVSDLHELSTNLRFGTFYLRNVLDDLDGSPLLASAGYNAGPNRPRRWRAALAAPVEGAVFAENIPFSETRDYVKKVLSNASIYASMMTGQPHSLRAMLGVVRPEPAGRTALP
ncbi:MAG: lytic transglycosylase domain-containing protein [Burkholderiaceae bacterium]|nr:lytic transglycosylase domain-containing protein [Burkholderiaceae bacterium]